MPPSGSKKTDWHCSGVLRRSEIMLKISWCLVVVAALCGGVRTATVTQVTWPVLLAEGPHWSVEEQVLYYVDIIGHLLLRWDPTEMNEFNEARVVRAINVGGDIGFAIPVAGTPGKFVTGVNRNLVYIDWTGAENASLTVDQLALIAVVDTDADKVGNRFNDAKADKTGRLWAGTMGASPDGIVELDKGTLYSLETNGTVPRSQVSTVSISNGIAWNRAGTVMYYIDTPKRTIDAFDYDLENGVISARRTVFDLADFEMIQGSPDGMTIDTDDHLWVALYGGGAVIQIDPSVHNKVLNVIDMPASLVTSVAFGGPELKTLFVTTSLLGLNAEELVNQPLAGSVFAVDLWWLDLRGFPGNNVLREV